MPMLDHLINYQWDATVDLQNNTGLTVFLAILVGLLVAASPSLAITLGLAICKCRDKKEESQRLVGTA